MKKILFAFILSVFALAESFAQDTIWKSAENAYATGDFDSAITSYESLVASGASSPSLFYNLGNAYYRRGNIGKAVLNYERALKLDPSDADAKHNLEYARAHTIDKIDTVPQFILFGWVKNLRNSFSSNAWAIISLVFLALGLALAFLYGFSRRSSSKKLFFITALIAFILTIACYLLSLSLANQAASGDKAIVIESAGSVKSAPAAGGNSIFVLHEGTKVTILESVQGWKRVEISDGRQGWIKESDLEII